MTNTGYQLFDQGFTLDVTNDSGTTAISAGDIVYATANTDKFGSTLASIGGTYSSSDVQVFRMAGAATGYTKVVGVAITDIAAAGKGTIALEGVFLHQASEAIVAGDAVQGYEGTANKLSAADASGATTAKTYVHKIGRSLTGASAANFIVLWKLTL